MCGYRAEFSICVAIGRHLYISGYREPFLFL